ncbi:MAG: hypothetical protein KDC83_13620 [Flavobacteriales bacterium]|nr:hypothetical protein [Flavobacteriales bacterium]
MEKIAEIEIRITGKSGNQNLKPDNFDIRHVSSILQHIEDMLYPTNKKERPLITYDLKEGSVRHLFKTTVQSVIGFSAIIAQIESSQSIDFLELKSARAFEAIQDLSRQKNFNFEITTSQNQDSKLNITPKTSFYRSENLWVDAEFYFYGILKDAGGKNKANIHIDTDDFGYLAISVGKDFLREQKENMLYKKFGVRAVGKQNQDTGEMDFKSLRLIELIDYNTNYDDQYLNDLIKKAKSNWNGVDANSWLNQLRGGYEA